MSHPAEHTITGLAEQLLDLDYTDPMAYERAEEIADEIRDACKVAAFAPLMEIPA